MNKTLGIIKPDAVLAHQSGAIIDFIEKNGFKIAKMKKLTLSDKQAREFYEIHNQRSWFGELVEFMTSGPVIVMELHAENAVEAWRTLMGATDPKNAALGTIRKMFARDIGKNAVHGSDSVENAEREVAFFFVDKCCK